MGTTASQPIYALQDVPGKGKGLIATRHIPQGTRIISEKPLLNIGSSVANPAHLPSLVYKKVAALSPAQQQEFLAMANVYPYSNTAERYHGIMRTNALPMGAQLDHGGIFPTACRINHACAPNATNFWNEPLQQLTIHAVRAISAGEEITISYGGSRRNREVRQQELHANFKFTCTCALCELPTDERLVSDAKLDRIHEIDCIIEREGIQGLTSPARRMLRYVDEQVRLWSEGPSPDVLGLGRAYPDAFQIAVANGDLARARVFAERVTALYLDSMGADSPDVEAYRGFASDPAGHEYYGLSMKWKTGCGDVPRGLAAHDFEDWLWRRRGETGSGPRAVVDLRDGDTFPPFRHLPHEDEVETDYVEYGDSMERRPRRHWCFFAEVHQVNKSAGHLDVVAVDAVGVPGFLILDASCKSGQAISSRIRKGHTIAVLYAKQHSMYGGRNAILVQNPRAVKVSIPGRIWLPKRQLM